jgi:hypothetical protein
MDSTTGNGVASSTPRRAIGSSITRDGYAMTAAKFETLYTLDDGPASVDAPDPMIPTEAISSVA